MTADWDHQSRTLAMQLTQLQPDGSCEDLHFIANSYTDPLDFELPLIGEYEWFRLGDSAQKSPLDIADDGQEFRLLLQESYTMLPKSVAIFVAK